jgi:hypothetical protein
VTGAAAAGTGGRTDEGRTDWRIVLRGALAILAVVVPASVVRAVLDHEMTNFDDSGWVYVLFVVVLVGYTFGGYVAGRAAPDLPFTHGILAGLGAIVLWIPVRVVVWAIREGDRGLFSGPRAALAPGQLFGALLLATAFASLGAWLGARRATQLPDTP